MNIRKKDVFLFLSVLSIILVAGILNFRVDGDVMWHYKTGEYIVMNKSIPSQDIFSWQQGLSWMCHEWLYDVGLYFAYSNGGAFAARVSLTFAIALPLLISFFYNRKKVKNPYLYLIFIAALMTFWNSSNCARPSEFSIAFMLIAAIFIIDDLRYKNIAFFICCLLCANIHGGSIAQLLIIPFLCLFSDIIVYIKKKEPVDFSLLLTFGIGFLGTLINPYGIKIYKYTTNIFFGADFINSHILEWQPNTITVITAVILFGLTLSLGGVREFRVFDKKAIRKYIIIFAFICQGLATKRMMFNATCILMIFAYEYFEKYIQTQFLGKRLTKIPNIVIPLLGLAVITLFYGSVNGYEKDTYIRLVEDSNPHFAEALNYAKDNIDGRIYANYNSGGNMILHDIKTFVDPRCDPFMESFSDSSSLTDYFTFTDAKDSTRDVTWNILNEKYDFEYAVLDMKNQSDRELRQIFERSQNTVLFENEGASVFKLDAMP